MMPNIATEFMLAILSLLAMLAIAAVPWAYKVHGRLTKIETHLQSCRLSNKNITTIEKQVAEHEFRIERLETVKQ